MRLIVGATANVVREKIFEELAAISARRGRAYVLVPEQFTMQTDLQLLARMERAVMMDIKVKSFGSLAREVFGRAGGSKLAYVNEGGRRMLTRYLLSAHREELSLLAGAGDGRGVAEKLLETMGEFRSLGMTSDAVADLAEGDGVPPLLAEKLQDTAVLLAHYETFIGERRLDNEARLALLAEKLPEADWLRRLPIYIDGFHALSQPEMAVLQALEHLGAEVAMTLVLPAEALSARVGWWTTHSACQASLRFYESLCRSGMALHVEEAGADETVIDAVKPLARGLFSYEGEVYAESAAAVRLWKAPEPQSEVTMLAGTLRQMVFEEGYRWRDFHIATNQAAVYFPLIERIFAQYDIPVFIDERQSIANHYLVRYILNTLDMVAHGFSYPMVFACLKTGLAGLDDEAVVALDYYARAKHLRGTMYFDARYFQPPEEAVRSRKLDGLRGRQEAAARAQLLFAARFEPLYEDLRAAQTVQDFSTIVYHMMTAPEVLDAFHADDGAKSPVQQETDAQIVAHLVALLEQLVGTIGDMAVSLETYTEILSEGLADASLGVVPPAQDAVQLGDLARARTGRPRVQVIVGMSDAWLPSAHTSRTVFIREEKHWLAEAGISLRYDETRLLEDEALCLYECLTKPRERLILSYPLSGPDGAAMNESVFIARAKEILPKVQEESVLAAFASVRPYLEWESLKDAMEWLRRYSKQPALADAQPAHVREVASTYRYFETYWPALAPFLKDGLYYSNLRRQLAPAVVRQLYSSIKAQRVSITELESWQDCPYKHFMRYGIRPEEPLDYTLRRDELGTVIHGSLDRLTSDLRKNPDWLEWDDAAICRQMDAYLTDEVTRTLDQGRRSEARNAAVLQKLRRQSHKAGRYIVRQLRESGFQPRLSEVPFGEDAFLPPIYLDIDGEIIRIEGRIDRVDTWSQGDTLYARVIDYKSGFNEFDITRVWAGLDLQLMLYLRAVLGWTRQPLPAGVFYLSLKSPFVDTVSRDAEEIESLMVQMLLMDGVFIDDPQVIDALDRGVRDGKKCVLARKGRGKTADNELAAPLLQKLLARTERLARDCARAVINGDIRVLPVEASQKGGCEYCDYGSICRFENNQSGNHERVIPSMTWHDVKEALSAEEDEA